MNGHLPQFVKTPQKHEGLLRKLVQFQLCGSWKRHKHARPTRLLERIPRRLGFPLQELVSQELLQAGTVFLGFLSNSQFVLSYTVHFEEDDMMGLPAYKYRLQWWVFVPYRPLVKVSETTLFGDHKINAELVLAVCQWPVDESKVLIYGCSLHEDLRCDHYLTIVGTPPLRPCANCSRLPLYPENSASSPERRCLRHGFVLHMSYQLEGAHLSFVPVLALKCDGLLLLNVGDALVILHIDVAVNPAKEKPSHCNAERGDAPQTLLNQAKDEPLPQNHTSSEVLFDSLLEEHLKSKRDLPQEAKDLRGSAVMPADTKQELEVSDVMKESSGSKLRRDSMESHESQVVSSSDLKAPEDEGPPGLSVVDADMLPDSCGDLNVTGGQRYSRAERLFDALLKEHLNKMEKTGRGRSMRRSVDTDELHEGEMLCGGQTLCSEEDNMSASLQVGNTLGGCVSTTRLYFAQGIEAAEEETCSSYLPLEVHGAGYRLLKPRPIVPTTTLGPVLGVCEIKFDMEAFADIVARKLCSEKKKVYCAFEDYDVRVVEVFPEDRTALLLFCVLVRAADPEGMDRRCDVGRATYRAGALLQWNLDTGHYVILRMDDLEEWERSEEVGSWKCNHQKVKQARKDCRLPPHPARSVTVFTNSPVVQGTSLTALWAPGHHFAITL
ncbi:uncharacterized protein LOC135390622 isoform X2 [Ornithodoros turicata]|uniref:uncharacterized protein LOC135390622 isoform X2 n=1 Tax=Ornithodoros turicata TaxID=34597 RepID=UPI00313A440B